MSPVDRALLAGGSDVLIAAAVVFIVVGGSGLYRTLMHDAQRRILTREPAALILNSAILLGIAALLLLIGAGIR